MVGSNCNITFERRVILLFTVIGVTSISASADISVPVNSNYCSQQNTDDPLFEDAPSSSEDFLADSTEDDATLDFPTTELEFNQETNPWQDKSKAKKNCQLPSIARRALVESIIKRPEFAINRSELETKLLKEEQTGKTREIKRNGLISEEFWTCQTKYEWLDMGVDHYPRYVRTAKCESRRCANGLFECLGRTYKTKILKRVTPGDSTACEESDNSLPGTLRSDWRLITLTIVHCCECSGRFSGTTG